ncbi:MAG TPA: hypothetical protein VHA10_24180 [Hypericibacter adhaerens]|jgi:hypothetical protein|uniref:Uncharacterized protein n=1 Tax=Hypericibacter adhaerens TaxID=2602016 RepID=A0A5J6MYG9_9PROT|nr:hypothetical protein [Hypericibacter adhaerens]QEX22003.1 hypothetical protein FRZ61_19320 [Hypericibacter adhaerens]HWA46338.1 hypothetical protein [Hypericibacter adhaerens]
MASTVLPGTGIRLDPDRIEKIEIACVDETRVEVRIFSVGEEAPRLFAFPDKPAAIAFYRDVWRLRSGQTLDDQQIQRLMEENGAELA